MVLTLPAISDALMRQLLPTTRPFTVVILHQGPAYDPPHTDAIVWERARRNFALRAAGLLRIVCPVADGSPLTGIGVFDADVAATEQLLRRRPAIRPGVLTGEVHASRSFPGDALPPPA